MKKIALLLVLVLTLASLTACGGKEKASDLSAALSSFALSEDMMELGSEDLMDYYGIDAADVKQFAGSISTTGVNCDEIVLIEAADAKAAERVKAALESRYQDKLNEADGYLPEQYAIIRECSVKTSGNYVSMIVAPNAAELVKAYEASFK